MLPLIALMGCSTPSGSPSDATPAFDPSSVFISPILRNTRTNQASPSSLPTPSQTPILTPPQVTNTHRAPTSPTISPMTPGPSPSPSPIRLGSPKGNGWVALEQWSQPRGLGKPVRVRNLPTWTYELKGSPGTLEVTGGKRTALWNGLTLNLGFAPRVTNGEPSVHALDITKTLEPLFNRPALLDRSNRIVVLDPGHGGDNYGAKSAVATRYEKEFTLDWAFRTERLLKAQGWQVYLTRTNDIEIPLPERVAFADRMKGDLFISLHFNSSDQPHGDSDQGGVETYCLTPVGMPSTLTRQFEDELNHAFPNNSFDQENYYFAARLQRTLVESTRRKDRGVRRARFMGILRTQNRPAILIEAGYLTLPAEARLIGTPDYRQKLAQAVASALTP